MCRPNPHHYTHYSTECDSRAGTTFGVGCDGTCEDCGQACDCICHSDYAPIFETNDEVIEFHQ